MATPYERVKAAWDATDRPAALNRVVEAMAAAGVTRPELDAALTALLLEIRAAGADDDTEEIINEVGDRLHHWCVPSGWIEPRTATLPSEEELLAVPRLALVAFAGRCARRVAPLYRYHWPAAGQARIDAVERATAFAEQVAGGVSGGADDRSVRLAAAHAWLDAHDEFADGAADAAHVADHAAAAAGNARLRTARQHVAYHVLSQFAVPLLHHARVHVRRDFDRLADVARTRQLGDDDPVPGEAFGDLWPEGVPPGWPVGDATSPPPMPAGPSPVRTR